MRGPRAYDRLSRFASVVLLRGTLSRPRKNNGKHKCFSMFTVFTADMVEEKGAPPGKIGKTRNIVFFYRFYRGYGRRKRSDSPLKTGTTTNNNVQFLPFLPRACLGNRLQARRALQTKSCLIIFLKNDF